MSPASLTPEVAPVLVLPFPILGLSVSMKNDHRSLTAPPNRMRRRLMNRLAEVACSSAVSSVSSWGCARKPILMFALPSFDSICHWADAGAAHTTHTTNASCQLHLRRSLLFRYP